MNDESVKIELGDGKYTYLLYSNGKQCALRYGEPWRSLTGDKFVYLMGQRIAELEAEVVKLKDGLDQAGHVTALIDAWVAEHGKIAWPKCVELTAVAMRLPDAERDRLLCLDYPDFPAKVAELEPDALRYRVFTQVAHLSKSDNPELHTLLNSMPESPTKEDFDRLFDAVKKLIEEQP